MAKKKNGRPLEGRDDGLARIDKGVLGMAQIVAKRRKIKLAAYLTDICKVTVEADFLAEMEKVKAQEIDRIGDE